MKKTNRRCSLYRAAHLSKLPWLIAIIAIFCAALLPYPARAQSATDLVALKGLAPVGVLPNTNAGRAALAANYTVTGGIQTGEIRQSTLLPFAQQQQQALRDAFIASDNLADLADGLGTTLGSAYVARAHYIDRTHSTKLSPELSDLIAYANATTAANSNAAKYYFANTTTNGKIAVSPEAFAILKDIGGHTDVFGGAYSLQAGSPGADAFGNSRPFQTEPNTSRITGLDYFNVPADNVVYNRGPVMNLVDSPSFPSGHTTYGYMGSLVLAVVFPERFQQMITRAAEYGNDRILMGAHYAMDVIAGRTLAIYDLAHLLANNSSYVGQTLSSPPGTPAPPMIQDFRAAIAAARTSVTTPLEAACGNTIAACAGQDLGRLSNPAADEALCAITQTYNLPVVYAKNAEGVEDVHTLAPEAGYLLTVAFPSLTLEQADQILTETESPGGGFLDDGKSPFGIYSRLNLYEAGKAAALASAPRREDSSAQKSSAKHN